MNQVIIINGPSCAGKTTIAKEICRQSNNKFIHLQIDKVGAFYSTIFLQNLSLQKMKPALKTMMID
ncbi:MULTISPECIES: phosphotransferase-like protein [spotted fever group]|uniref:Chloramphenicol phosphotransferase-like family protein n=1 Tax=Rickettsia rhipicephali str. Ect TaxID=1359199 RepID=A0A0F3PFH8_RICRH|nr:MULTISPECIES: hypothetical protein [spotted fever group]KJV78656.1 chloramphenicol phosphotransferase-like family protein [Rickettsia rhipicephali str. Ect]